MNTTIGQIRSLVRLINSNTLENKNLVFAIMKGDDVTPKQRVKFLEYLHKVESINSFTSEKSIYIIALTAFYPDLLNYHARTDRGNSKKTT